MINRIFVPAVIIALLAGCATTQHAAPRPAPINHVVLFKLENPDDAQALIQDCDEKLGTIPGVVSYYCGTPYDAGRDSPAIDDNYHVGFYVGFNNAEAYENYVEHPDHIAVVNKWRPKFEWLRIYDVEDNTP